MGMVITRRSATVAITVTIALGATKAPAGVVALNEHLKQHTEDLDTLLELGAIRMLVPYSRTFFFENKGSFHGVSAEIADKLEKYVRRSYSKNRLNFVVVVIPTSRERLLSDLLAGWAVWLLATLLLHRNEKNKSPSQHRHSAA